MTLTKKQIYNKEYHKKYYLENKEKYKEHYKKYNLENKEERKAYREQNKEYYKSWFRRCYKCRINNKISTSAARIMAFKATYTECQHCGSNKKLHVDHDHDTGELRGILCASCNVKDVFAGKGEVF